MEVQLETPGGLARRLHVRVEAGRVDSAFDARLKKFASRARIPGFRPGKAPMKVIRQQYGDAAHAEIIRELVGETYPQALSEAKLAPAGAPSFEVVTEKPGEGLVYVASFEVYPEIQLQALDAISIKQPAVEITEADVDRLVENLRKTRRSWSVVTRQAQSGDQVVVDFNGQLDGEDFAGGKGEKIEIELGAGQFLPGLENTIPGHAAGETFSADVDFPADYRAENLRGKTARFEIVLQEVREPRLPEIDAEFLQQHGLGADAGIEGLRTKCRGALENERDKAVRARTKQQILEELLRLNPIEVPTALVAEEINRLRDEMAENLVQSNRVDKSFLARKKELLPDGAFEINARRRVALGLLIGEAIRSANIQLDEARVERALDSVAGDYEEPDDVRRYYRSRPEMMQGLRAVALEDQLVEHLTASAKVEPEPMSLEVLLNPKQAA